MVPHLLHLAQAVDAAAASEDGNTSADSKVNVEMESAWETVASMIDGFISLLPKLAIAGGVFLLFLALAWIVKWVIHRQTEDHPTAALPRVLGRIAQWTIVLAGLMVSVAIVAPSVTHAKLLSALGIGGVAIG